MRCLSEREPMMGQGKGEQTSLEGRGKIQKEEGRKLTFSELLLGLRPFIHLILHIVQRPRKYG